MVCTSFIRFVLSTLKNCLINWQIKMRPFKVRQLKSHLVERQHYFVLPVFRQDTRKSLVAHREVSQDSPPRLDMLDYAKYFPTSCVLVHPCPLRHIVVESTLVNQNRTTARIVNQVLTRPSVAAVNQNTVAAY